MFLKSLEVRGFKSFADKTELRFNKGITAVVGPNGSGKSNVSDAVRWVLGEQSAKTLRGSKMEDIIFTGTEYRKAIGIANVSLTLDNSDGSLPINFNEVRVTRRIYRSGESEYLINNTSCRLKDVVNLFMDTGIGKEGYSLIGQGKIDAILSGKSEDRRALLEEAAGIVKYKTRKIEAEKKLKNTDQNLTRINDIVFTYEERLAPLEEDKKKAEKYLYLSSELKHMDVNLLVNNLIIIDEKIKEKELVIKNLESNNKVQKEKNNNTRESLKNLRLDLEKLENDNKEKNELYISTKDAVNNAVAENSLLEERIRSYNEQIKKSKSDIAENDKKIKAFKKDIDKLKEILKLDIEKLEEVSKTLDVQEQTKTYLVKEILNKQKNIEDLKNKDIEAIKEESNYLNKKAVFENKLEHITEAIHSNNIRTEGFEATLKINTLLKANLDGDILKLNDKRDELLLEREKKLEAINSKKNDLELKNKSIQDISKNLSRLEANKEMLEKLEKSYEGYNVSVKKLMANVQKGMVDISKDDSVVLGAILNARQGFELAIEISLAGAISNIITKDEFVAKKMIEHLKKYKLGRATFLPLSVIKGKKIIIDESLKSFNGFLGIASEIVEYDKKYENVVNYTLGRTLICKDIDSAIELSKKTSYRYKIVTLEGEVVNAGGALTGGSSYQKSVGIISRKTEIEKLENDIRSLKEKNNKAVSSKQKLNQDIVKYEEALKNHDDAVRKCEIEKINIENETKRVGTEIFNLKTNLKNSILELKNHNGKKDSIILELEKNEKRYRETSKNTAGNKEFIEAISKELNILLSEKDKLDKSITAMKIEIAKLKANIDSKNKDISREEKEILELEQRVESFISSQDDALNKIENSKSKILENKSFINYENEKLTNIEEKNKSFELYKGQIKEKINKLESKIELLTLGIAKSDEEIHRHKILFTKNESERDNSIAKLEDEYKIDIDDAMDKFEKIIDIEKHKTAIYSLKSRINALGTVNVNAIDEFRDVSEKYRFITSERADLENAKNELMSIIDDMTAQMKVIFRQNFNILNNNFDSTFKELFKGGSAKLILDEEDELSGDIEIRVQPPGKKIQNINLMSGGEKVLSAIALLFAILRMKPTPFCILDEIEAALDDANVSRYAEFLKQFADNIQFIVITHRKGTMEVADVMYGVTMEEKGISKIVSVDLNKKVKKEN